MADKTRRAYAIDSGQFATWASERDLPPAAVDLRALRRYARWRGCRSAARRPSTVGRKLAALRGLFRVQMELGQRSENPAALLSSPKRGQRLPRVLRSSEIAALLDRIPATTPLELRDRALFELAYASGLRAEELVTLDVESIDFDSRDHPRGGQGRKDPARARRGARPIRARTLPGQGPSRARHIGCGQRAVAVSVKDGQAAQHVRCPPASADLGATGIGPGAGARRRSSPRPAPFVCDPSPGGRGRPPGDPGIARPRSHFDDAGLHSGRVGALEISLRARPSTGLATARARGTTGHERQSDRASRSLEALQGLR